MINVLNLNKYYNKGKSNEIHVINDVSLTLPEVGLITFLGKSGSGKTTLLNVLGGLDRATGVICYDNEEMINYNMNKIDKYRREHIGYVFQNYNLLKDKTVWENLEIALEVINIVDKDEVKKRIEHSLKAVGLYKYRKKQAFALSGGQMQRVSIARALVKNSKIIIADEPTGNLDSENSLEVMNILKKISKNSLVLLVTHDKQLAEFYSDRIIEICDGKIENIRETKTDASLTGIYNDNKIYLQDLNKVENDDGFLKYQLYAEEEVVNLELTIIKKNNQFYLKSNQKIKLLEESNLKIIDEHRNIDKEKIVDEFNYDTTWYNDKKSYNIFKDVSKNIKYSIKDFFKSKKRAKLFHFAFFLIGVIIALLNITFVSYSKVNTSYLVYDRDIYGIENYSNIVYTDDYSKYLDTVKTAFKDGKIKKFYNSNSVNLYDYISLSSFDNREIETRFLSLDDELIDNYKLIVGKSSTNNQEVVISSALADIFINKLNLNKNEYEALIDKTFHSNEYECKIVGVIKKDSIAVYSKNNVEKNIYYNDKRILNAKYYNYEINTDISNSRDIKNNLEGLVSETSRINIGDMVGDIKIVGKYKSNNVDEINYENTYFNINDNMIIVNDGTYSYIEYFYVNGYFQPYFSINDIEEINVVFSTNGFKVSNSYDLVLKTIIDDNRESKYEILLPAMIIMVAITLVYIYFSMRSKMINDIYSIGVYRSLGFSKSRINLKYACDIFVITLLTSLLGYLIVSGVYNFIAIKFSEIGITMHTVFDYYSTYVMIFILIFTNIVIGLIPIVSLMKKSPSEIIAKYDI